MLPGSGNQQGFPLSQDSGSQVPQDEGSFFGFADEQAAAAHIWQTLMPNFVPSSGGFMNPWGAGLTNEPMALNPAAMPSSGRALADMVPGGVPVGVPAAVSVPLGKTSTVPLQNPLDLSIMLAGGLAGALDTSAWAALGAAQGPPAKKQRTTPQRPPVSTVDTQETKAVVHSVFSGRLSEEARTQPQILPLSQPTSSALTEQDLGIGVGEFLAFDPRTLALPEHDGRMKHAAAADPAMSDPAILQACGSESVFNMACGLPPPPSNDVSRPPSAGATLEDGFIQGLFQGEMGGVEEEDKENPQNVIATVLGRLAPSGIGMSSKTPVAAATKGKSGSKAGQKAQVSESKRGEKGPMKAAQIQKALESDSFKNRKGNWRKYGQKRLDGNRIRSYYRCNYPGCPVKRQVVCTDGKNGGKSMFAGMRTTGEHMHEQLAAVTGESMEMALMDMGCLIDGKDRGDIRLRAVPQPSHAGGQLLIPRQDAISQDATVNDLESLGGPEAAVPELDVAFLNKVGMMAPAFLISDPRQPGFPIVFVSPGFTLLTGYTSEDLIGRNCRILQGNQTDPNVVQQIREAVQQHQEIRTVILNYKKSGDKFLNLLHITPVKDSQGNTIALVGMQMDVTKLAKARQGAVLKP